MSEELTPRDQFIIEFYGSRCALCGEYDNPKNLEMAHLSDTGLNGRGRGSKERLRDIKNNPDKYRPMHKPCHRLYDKSIREDQVTYPMPYVGATHAFLGVFDPEGNWIPLGDGYDEP